jgi:hypothetical protein
VTDEFLTLYLLCLVGLSDDKKGGEKQKGLMLQAPSSEEDKTGFWGLKGFY